MTASKRAIELTHVAARAAADKKARELVALDVSERLALTDVFLVAAGANERQVAAIVDEVERKMHEAGAKVKRREGKTQARWVLLDFEDIVVHVQHRDDREFYALERLWSDCPVVELPADLEEPAGDDDEWSAGPAGHPIDDDAAHQWWAAAEQAAEEELLESLEDDDGVASVGGDGSDGLGEGVVEAPPYDPADLPGEPLGGDRA